MVTVVPAGSPFDFLLGERSGRLVGFLLGEMYLPEVGCVVCCRVACEIRGRSRRSLTPSAVTHNERTISNERNPRMSMISSFGLTSRYAPKLTKSLNRRPEMLAMVKPCEGRTDLCGT